MAFKTSNDKKYFIVPKHSQEDNRVLGVANKNQGEHIQLQESDPSNPYQQFRLDRWDGEFFILIEPYTRFAIVHAWAKHSHTPEKQAPLIQWEWQGNEHMKFQLIPAGGGYYHIRAPHSGHYWDVFKGEKRTGTDVVQHALTGNPNQLFALIPLPGQDVQKKLIPFVQVNEQVRDAVVGIITAIPKVGGGLGFIVRMFWAGKDKLSDLWSQMQSYIEIRVSQMILQDKCNDMGKQLRGILNVIASISTSEDDNKVKGERMRALHDRLIELGPFYTDRPVEVLPYLVNYGTIVFTVWKELIENYEELFGKPLTEKRKKKEIGDMTDFLNKLTGDVMRGREKMMSWRLGQIHKTENKLKLDNYVIVSDDYENWKHKWQGYVRKEDPAHPGHVIEEYGLKDYEIRSTNHEIFLKRQATIQFGSELDVMLEQVEFWPDFIPDAKNKKVEKKIRKSLESYGGSYSQLDGKFAGTENSEISEIRFHASKGLLCGLEIFYAGKSAGLHGAAGDASDVLKLEPGEYITTVSGYANLFVEGLWMGTNKGKYVGAGLFASNRDQFSAKYFNADLADGLNAKLIKISGAVMPNQNVIEQLDFEWEYAWYV